MIAISSLTHPFDHERVKFHREIDLVRLIKNPRFRIDGVSDFLRLKHTKFLTARRSIEGYRTFSSFWRVNSAASPTIYPPASIKDKNSANRSIKHFHIGVGSSLREGCRL